MMRKAILLLFLLAYGLLGQAQAQTLLKGTVKDKDTGEGLMETKVLIYQDGKFIVGVLTDMDGNFIANNLVPGHYDLIVNSIAYPQTTLNGIRIKPGIDNRLEILMEPARYGPPGLVIVYRPKIVAVDDMTHGHVFRSDDLKRSPFR